MSTQERSPASNYHDEPSLPSRQILDIPRGAKWKVLGKYEWKRDMCKGLQFEADAARYVWIRMGPPRTITRLKEGANFLGFVKARVTAHSIWRAEQRWDDAALAYDLGIQTVAGLQERLREVRNSMLTPIMHQLNEAIATALNADRIEAAIKAASKNGDFTGIVNGAKELMAIMANLAGDPMALASINQHQHQHLHAGVNGGAAPVDQATALPSPTGTPFLRALGALDKFAADKRANGIAATIEAAAVTVTEDAKEDIEESDDGRQSEPATDGDAAEPADDGGDEQTSGDGDFPRA